MVSRHSRDFGWNFSRNSLGDASGFGVWLFAPELAGPVKQVSRRSVLVSPIGAKELVDFWGLEDNFARIQQLGIIPEAGQSGEASPTYAVVLPPSNCPAFETQ